ncbi:MAG TPA: hypothetical protein VFX49_19740 [Chloroflexota bacterium]|nr:hypothetical protein [Chloroflexota bacterium]
MGSNLRRHGLWCRSGREGEHPSRALALGRIHGVPVKRQEDPQAEIRNALVAVLEGVSFDDALREHGRLLRQICSVVVGVLLWPCKRTLKLV